MAVQKKKPAQSTAKVKKTTAKRKTARPAAPKKTTAKKTAPPKTADTKKQPRKDETELLKKIESSLKEVSEDATVFASDIASKTSKIAEELYSKLKKGVSEAYDASAVVLDDLVQTADKYADKYKNKIEMRRLNTERDGLAKQLGSIVYVRFKQKKPFDARFFSDKKLNSLMDKIENLDKEIVKIGKTLDKK